MAENIGQTVIVDGSVKPEPHKPGNHTFSITQIDVDPEMIERRFLIQCLPCRVNVGVHITCLIRIPADAPLEDVIAGLQSVLKDKHYEGKCEGRMTQEELDKLNKKGSNNG